MITPPAQLAQHPLRWSVHPARERFLRLTFVSVTLIGFGVLASILMNHVAWGLLSVVIMVVLLSRFFLPTKYELDRDGIAASHLLQRQRLRWDDIRSIRVGKEAALVALDRARRSRRSRPEMHVLFGRDGHAARSCLLACIDEERTP